MGVEYDGHDDESFIRGVADAQRTHHPFTGESIAMRTTQSQETEPRRGLTTFTVSELMQGMGSHTPKGLAYDAFNQSMSGDLGHFIDSEGGAGGTLGKRAPLLAYDIAAGKRGFSDGIFTQKSGLPGMESRVNTGVGSVTGEGQSAHVSTRPRTGTLTNADSPQSMGLQNGRIPPEYMVPLGIKENDTLPGAIAEHMLWEPAALDFLDMMDAMEADTGGSVNRNMIGETYRTYEKQEYFYMCMKTGSCNKGRTAADPGTSQHGWGMAIDFGAASDWLKANGQRFNWFFANIPKEPWHFEHISTGKYG